MGMAAAAILTTKMIYTFAPRYVIMAGIAAGIEGRVNIGDIIAAEYSWDYESGKFDVRDGLSRFVAGPVQVAVDVEVRERLVEMAGDAVEFANIASRWSGPTPATRLRMVVGPVASGASVVANPEKVDEIKERDRKVIGIEMETYGVFVAAAESPNPRARAMSLKSVCDYANSSKSDDYQAYAAYTSAEAVRAFCERYS
jgi:nucleoside phosphorylase